MNFFVPIDDECASTSSAIFYLYDDENQTTVYFSTQKTREYCTEVVNKAVQKIILRPVDHCIYPENGAIHCDAFLHNESRKTLCFVEMKNVSKSWASDAIAQLEQTVKDFNAAHGAIAEDALYKRAYAANSKHPNFSRSHATQIREFYQRTGFVLRVENTVKLP